MNNKVLIRVDSSNILGTGHLNRCLVLAEQLLLNNWDVYFATLDLAFNSNYLIDLQKFKVFNLQSNPHKIGSLDFQKFDAECVIKICKNYMFALVVVDHYWLDYVWEKEANKHTGRLLVIDDMTSRRHECDIYLNQNFSINANSVPVKRCNLNSIKLLGLKYNLIRQDLIRPKRPYQTTRDNISTVFIFFGSTDPLKITKRVIQILQIKNLANFRFSVVVGQNNSDKSDLLEICNQSDNLQLFVQPNNFVEIMKNSAFAIGSGGVNLWERMTIGLPSLVISNHPNQIPCCTALQKQGQIKYLGCFKSFKEQELIENIRYLGNSPEQLKTLKANNLTCIDLNGPSRVVKVINKEVSDHYDINCR